MYSDFSSYMYTYRFVCNHKGRYAFDSEKWILEM